MATTKALKLDIDEPQMETSGGRGNHRKPPNHFCVDSERLRHQTRLQSRWCWLLAPSATARKKRKISEIKSANTIDKKSGVGPFRSTNSTSKETRWHWLLLPDGSFSTVDSKRTNSAAVHNSPTGRVANTSCEETRWHWLLLPDGSYSTVDSKRTNSAAVRNSSTTCDGNRQKSNAVENKRTKIEERSTRKLEQRTKTFPKVEKAFYGNRKRKKRGESLPGSWYWLKAPDGSYALGEPNTKKSKPRIRPATKSSIHTVNYAESEDEDGVEFTDSWSDGSSSSEIDEDGDKDEDYASEDHESAHTHDQTNTTITTSSNKKNGSWKNCILRCEEIWKEKYQQLVEYKTKHGTTRVPGSNPKLVNWISFQRELFWKGKLSSNRKKLLNLIGFEWKLRTLFPWIKMYNQLRSYKRQHNGSVDVPQRHNRLGPWVASQRKLYSKGKLLKERVDLLESIGFKWRLKDPKPCWMIMYNRLVAYKKKQKHTRVPRNYKEDPQLAEWVKSQRNRCMKKDRIDLLNEIGFQWDPRGDYWMNMYHRLVVYKKKYGGTSVSDKHDLQLAKWAYKQRYGCQDPYRIELLNDIGFVWKTKQIR